MLIAAFVPQTMFVFFDAAAFGALPTLVGRDLIGAANAAIWGFGGVLDLGVPMLAGVLLAVLHPAVLLSFDALSFLVSAVLIASIRRPLTGDRAGLEPLAPRRILAEVADGLRYLWRHAGVRSMTAVGTLQSVSGAGFMALAVPYADRLLHVGTSGWRFGALFAGWGIGGIVSAAITPRLLRVRPPAWLTLVFLPVAAVSGLVVAVTSSFAVAVLVMVVWGIAYQAVLMNSITYRQQESPEHLLGRVNTAGRMLSFGVGYTGGAAAAGGLAGQFGVRAAMVTLVAFGVVATGLAWTSPLRHLAR